MPKSRRVTEHIALLASALVLTCAARAASVWIEGENVDRDAMNRHPWWYDQVKPDALSSGAWISNFNAESEGVAEYDFEIAEAGAYRFWVRANPLAVKLVGSPVNVRPASRSPARCRSRAVCTPPAASTTTPARTS